MENHLDKIKKLLKLSKSSNAHEAELAMAKAMELAARHEIDLSTLSDDAEVSDIIHRWFPMKARLSREWRLALNVAAAHFHVKPCICRGRKQVVFIGRADAIEVADYIITFLVREVRSQVATFAKGQAAIRRKMTSGKRAGFITGFFTGIHNRLDQGTFDLMREDSRYALILVSEKQKREDALNQLLGKTMAIKIKRPRMSMATLAGFKAGRETTLARPLPGAAPKQGMLALN